MLLRFFRASHVTQSELNRPVVGVQRCSSSLLERILGWMCTLPLPLPGDLHAHSWRRFEAGWWRTGIKR